MKHWPIGLVAVCFTVGAAWAGVSTTTYASLSKPREVSTESAEGLYQRGQKYASGAGGARDYLRAMEYYRRAAEQGHVAAQYSVGWLFEQGLGVTKDTALAKHWYRQAAEQGDAQAQTNLGVLYATEATSPSNWQRRPSGTARPRRRMTSRA